MLKGHHNQHNVIESDNEDSGGETLTEDPANLHSIHNSNDNEDVVDITDAQKAVKENAIKKY
ncbi:hypothetical protein GYMLUDRAFT_252780 [Collybiopsis luxurians FD-317 M1]|uniref:Uncharacterized protein n=1 Tax=Collybiopsis luxurians FD-317 M1 TaxID=944289 RepID=A0A0D0AKE2_9AGAR|nr:hypothetical protein GYMLUDRAFT_252780 [Collybiopsis luxurians FD-317 M1]